MTEIYIAYKKKRRLKLGRHIVLIKLRKKRKLSQIDDCQELSYYTLILIFVNNVMYYISYISTNTDIDRNMSTNTPHFIIIIK